MYLIQRGLVVYANARLHKLLEALALGCDGVCADGQLGDDVIASLVVWVTVMAVPGIKLPLESVTVP